MLKPFLAPPINREQWCFFARWSFQIIRNIILFYVTNGHIDTPNQSILWVEKPQSSNPIRFSMIMRWTNQESYTLTIKWISKENNQILATCCKLYVLKLTEELVLWKKKHVLKNHVFFIRTISKTSILMIKDLMIILTFFIYDNIITLKN